jgi:uncharacterized protein (AIM24 family)
MSTLVAQTISNGTVSTSSANVIQGSAKAWVNFYGTGTVAIRASYNVSSITDNGTGDYTVNFTNAFTDANYAIAFSGDVNTSVSNNDVRAVNFGAPAAGSLRIFTGNNYTSVSGEDWALICLSVFR